MDSIRQEIAKARAYNRQCSDEMLDLLDDAEREFTTGHFQKALFSLVKFWRLAANAETE